MNKLLETRNKAKAKKPVFERQDSNIFKQFKGTYRKPKGIHSKMRRGYKGHRVIPTIGYSSPRSVRGLTKEGLKPVVVVNLNELLKIQNGEGVIISRKLGLKKKLVFLQKAQELKLQILNIKNVDEFLKKSKEKFESKKEEHKGKQEERKKTKQEAEKKASEKEKTQNAKKEDSVNKETFEKKTNKEGYTDESKK